MKKDMHEEDGGVHWYKLQKEKNTTKVLKFPSRDLGSKNEHGLAIAFEREIRCEKVKAAHSYTEGHVEEVIVLMFKGSG